jgi:acyl dehydratase
MSLDVKKLLSTEINDLQFEYSHAQSILYALGVGFGIDPTDRRTLPYVYEQSPVMRTVPTMASVLVPDLFPPDLGWDYEQVLHVGQAVKLFRPLPSAASLLINKRITDVLDRGRRGGALVVFEAEGRLAKDDTVIFSLQSTVLARGDGGFGGQKGNLPTPHRPPDREPDFSTDLQTTPEQALLYRLNGDWNPLHADPVVAREAGFERPILHGLCTFGFAANAILQTICNYDHTLITDIEGRFSQPVLPGDVLTTDMWQDGNTVSFQCRVKSRDHLVFRNGRCVLKS